MIEHLLTNLQVHGVYTAVVLLIAVGLILMWRWRWRDYRLLRRLAVMPLDPPAEAEEVKEEVVFESLKAPRPKVSLVLLSCNQVEELKANIPVFFMQTLKEMEIIVVDMGSTDETPALLEYLAANNPRLRYTLIPPEADNENRRQLAITLGVRAAKADWVVVTDVDCEPQNAEWLETLASAFRDDRTFVLGYFNFNDEDDSITRSAIYERLRMQAMRYRSAVGTGRRDSNGVVSFKGRAIGGNTRNMAINKRRFLEAGGFTHCPTLFGSENNLLVDSLATPGSTAVVARPEACVRVSIPLLQIMKAEGIRHQRALRHLSRRGQKFRLRESAASWTLWILIIIIAAYATVRTMSYIDSGLTLDRLQYVHYDLLVFLLTLTVVFLPGRALRRATKALGERSFNWLWVFFRQLFQPFITVQRKFVTYRALRRSWRR